MKKEEQPTCIPCDAPLTVKHILIECVDFAETRKKHYRLKNLKDRFSWSSVMVMIVLELISTTYNRGFQYMQPNIAQALKGEANKKSWYL